jgi:class 3 adenylate cyclase
VGSNAADLRTGGQFDRDASVPTSEIIDVDRDPQEELRRRLRLALRVGLPIAAVLLIVAAIAGTTWYAYVVNRRDALALSRDALASIDQRIVSELQGYLAPPVRVLNLIRWVATEGTFDSDRALAERLAMQILLNVPQLAIVSFADDQGQFMMLRRSADGAIDTKLILQTQNGRRVTWVRRDPEGRTVAVEDDPDDTYDPRTRPWYQGALTTDGVYWTDVYVFFTDREPGITVSTRIDRPEGRPTIVGVDIRLEALSTFLGGLKIGKTGRAMIVDDTGRLVAFPEPQRMMTEEAGQPVAARLDALGDPLLTKVYDRLRVLGSGQHIMIEDGVRYVIARRPLQDVVGRDWWLLFVVPEDDFVGFVAVNNRTTLLMSAAVVALAVALAALLIAQGIRGDRIARGSRRRQRALEAQALALAQIAAATAVFDPQQPEGAAQVTRIAAEAVGARRVSLWRFDVAAVTLACEACWDRETKGVTTGIELARNDCPTLFEALVAGDEIEVADAAADPRTADLHRTYLQPIGCRSLLSVPVRRAQEVAGCLWAEDGELAGEARKDTITLLRALAGMLAPRFAGRTGTVTSARWQEPAAAAAVVSSVSDAVARPGPVAPRPAMRTCSIATERTRRLTERLHAAAQGANGPSTAVRLFPDTTVLALRFLDPGAFALAGGSAGEPSTMDRIARSLQKIAADHDIAYLKLFSDQVVTAEGFSGDPHHRARAIIEVALAIEDAFARLAAETDRTLEFAIGIDTGMAIGSPVGFGGGAYNLWGDAVRVASTLATSAPPGQIQVTETTERLVSDRYLFRRRGAFYLERVGELSTYLLKGRL